MRRAWGVLAVVACGSTAAPTAHAPPAAANDPAFAPPAPTHYTARLAIDPSKPTFAGEIAIDGMLDRRTATIWLHGKHLEVARAVASDGQHEIALAVTAKDDLLALLAAQPLESGTWTLTLTYAGHLELDGFEGAVVSKYVADPYVVTQFEATANATRY